MRLVVLGFGSERPDRSLLRFRGERREGSARKYALCCSEHGTRKPPKSLRLETKANRGSENEWISERGRRIIAAKYWQIVSEAMPRTPDAYKRRYEVLPGFHFIPELRELARDWGITRSTLREWARKYR